MTDTLLIVEDQENDALFLKHALKKAGVNNPVQVVEDGQQAIDYLSGQGGYADRAAFPIPSLIFLDLKLPQVSGLEVLHWIREQADLGPIVVVVMTSSTMDEDIVQAYRLGANSYVVKPCSLEKLLETVTDLANWWLKHDQLRGRSSEATRLEICGLPE